VKKSGKLTPPSGICVSAVHESSLFSGLTNSHPSHLPGPYSFVPLVWSLHSASVEAKQHSVHCTDLHAVLVDIGTVLFVVILRCIKA